MTHSVLDDPRFLELEARVSALEVHSPPPWRGPEVGSWLWAQCLPTGTLFRHPSLAVPATVPEVRILWLDVPAYGWSVASAPAVEEPLPGAGATYRRADEIRPGDVLLKCGTVQAVTHTLTPEGVRLEIHTYGGLHRDLDLRPADQVQVTDMLEDVGKPRTHTRKEALRHTLEHGSVWESPETGHLRCRWSVERETFEHSTIAEEDWEHDCCPSLTDPDADGEAFVMLDPGTDTDVGGS